MLWRMAKPSGDFLGRIRVTTVTGGESRNIYKPLDNKRGINPKLPIEQPHPGVFVFSFNSDFIYPNVNHYTDKLVYHILDNTRATTANQYARLGDRPWNDPKPRAQENDLALPTLKAVIYDMSAVGNVDVTSVQIFVDVKRQLDRHAAPEQVYFHFAGIRSPWTRRALASAGFGHAEGPQPVFSVATSASGEVRNEKRDGAAAGPSSSQLESGSKLFLPVTSTDRPTFNTDLDEALEMCLINIGAREPQRRNSFAGYDQKDGEAFPTFTPGQSPTVPILRTFAPDHQDLDAPGIEADSKGT
jgi:sodium-independent sulfate anion transporter 11